MFKVLAPAACATFLALSPAQALPVPAAASPIAAGDTAALTLIADRDGDGRRDGMRRGGDHDRRHWVPGRRYDNAPSGWNRYSRRPGNWRSRGCILVGPIWFCP